MLDIYNKIIRNLFPERILLDIIMILYYEINFTEFNSKNLISY